MFFAGCGIVSRQVRALGFTTREWELLKGGDCDLTRPAVLRPVRQMARRGQILSAFLAPPCGSFSLINRSVSRSKCDPWGLGPQESEKARASVTVGNRCMKAAIQIIKWLEQEKVPWIMEHPLSSRAWYIPFFNTLLRKDHVVALDLDQCQYGVPWRKSTRLICSRIDPCSFERLNKRCRKDEFGRCGRTHKFHIQLRGTHPSGVPWTSIASPYPKCLARHIAFSLMEGHMLKCTPQKLCHSRNRH